MVVKQDKGYSTEVHFKDFHEFARDLGRSAYEIAYIERVFSATAAITIVKRARAMAESQGGIAAKSATDIRAAAQPGVVVYGGQGYNFGAEFGAYRYKRFKIWRGNQDDAGYFFWPSIRQFRDKEMLENFTRDMHKALKPSFPQ